VPKRTSRAAEALRVALEELGEKVSTRQLERLGTAGLLEPTTRQPLGRGRGSISTQRPDAVRRAREALALIREHGRLDLAALAMFVRGYALEKSKLEQAYTQALLRLEAEMERVRGDAADYAVAIEIAGRLARAAARSPEQRALRTRLKRARQGRRYEPLRWLLQSLYIDAVLIMLSGRASSDQALTELMEATGVAAATSDHFKGERPPVTELPLDDLRALVRQTSFGAIARTVGLASQADLEVARADALAIVRFARAFTPVVQKVHGLPDAFGFASLAGFDELAVAFAIPGLLNVRSREPGEMDDLRMIMDAAAPRFEALSSLLDRIPARYHHVFQGSEHMDELSSAERAELRTIIDDFERTEPEKYELGIAAW
jgi:hypothetical protein